MGSTKQKAVINAEKAQLHRVRKLVDSGRYSTVSEFMREAVAEKLERIENDRVAEAVARYCSAGHADEDADLIGVQALEGKRPPRKSRGSRRAPR